ncbi:hypothetical protein BGZ99_003579 [Dissophora globulifera]|uniref:Uncharacterized protein n=1 Tax=Dissophora globulifera TaxID=979702 RepID=A0A9P6UGW8_9FUNG|nr:hypothetical protein BGZ99_003579 [Dissophora globulifera]
MMELTDLLEPWRQDYAAIDISANNRAQALADWIRVLGIQEKHFAAEAEKAEENLARVPGNPSAGLAEYARSQANWAAFYREERYELLVIIKYVKEVLRRLTAQ